MLAQNNKTFCTGIASLAEFTSLGWNKVTGIFYFSDFDFENEFEKTKNKILNRSLKPAKENKQNLLIDEISIMERNQP